MAKGLSVAAVLVCALSAGRVFAGDALTSTSTGCKSSRPLRLIGTIVLVNPAKQLITVEDRAGVKHEVKVVKSTILRRGRDIVTLSDIPARWRIVVQYYLVDKEIVARFVSVPPDSRFRKKKAAEEER